MGRLSEELSKTMPMGEDIREFADADTCQAQLSALLEREVAMQWVYTGGAIDYYAYANQFFDMFPQLPRSELLSIHHLPQSDHLATLRVDRLRILRLVTDWCVERVEARKSIAQLCECG